MEKNKHDDADPARGERDAPSDVAREASEESVPAEELSAEEAAAADSDRAPVPDTKSSARVPKDI